MSLWNLDMDWESDEEVSVEPFNQEYALELFESGFGSWEDCCYEAAATMEGVAEDKYGNVHGRQANCNILNYNEEL